MSGKQSAYMNGYDYMRIKGYAKDDLEAFLEEAKLSRVQFKTLKCQNDFVQGLTDYYHIIKRGRELHAIDNPTQTENNAHNHTVTYVDANNHLIFEEKVFSCCDEVIKQAENSTIEGCTFINISCRFLLKGLKPLQSLRTDKHKTPKIDFRGIPLHTLDPNELVICTITFTDDCFEVLDSQKQYMTYGCAMEYALKEAKHGHPSCMRIFIHLSCLSPDPDDGTYNGGNPYLPANLPKDSSPELYTPAKVILINFEHLPVLEDALTGKTLSLGLLKRLQENGYKFESYHGHFSWTYEELLRLKYGEYTEL